MIYFISDPLSGCVKIGTSRNVESRFASLQSASPRDLRLMGSIEGGYQEEALFHRAFCRQHLRNEWFMNTAILTNLIEAAAKHGFAFVEPKLRDLAKDGWGINIKSEDGLRRIREAVCKPKAGSVAAAQ